MSNRRLNKDNRQMVNKHMLIIRAMQINNVIPIRVAEIQNTDDTKCWQGCRATGTLLHCWWECKMVQSPWEAVWQLLLKLNILFTMLSGNCPPLDIYPKELKTYVHTETCTWMFIATLFTIAKMWKQPKYLL